MKSAVKNIYKSAKAFVEQNKTESILLLIILLTGAFLRLYRISEYMTFLGDEGRDAIIVRRFLVKFDPILIGPGTSIGNMYLGPLYYYLIAPSLLIAGFSPVGPSVFVALLGVATIYFIWLVIRKWFPVVKGIHWGSLAAALLYAVSPVIIVLSRSSWNPNVMPFFALLCIYSIWKTYEDLSFSWLILTSVAFAMVLNSHYLGLLILPVVAVFWLFTLNKIISPGIKSKLYKSKFGSFRNKSVLALLIFLFLMSPLFVFDARHNWINSLAIKKFFTERDQTVSIKPWKALPEIPQIGSDVFSRLLGGTNISAGKFSGNFLLALSVYAAVSEFIKRKKAKKVKPAKSMFNPVWYLLLFLWIGSGLVGLALYKQHIYDHYYGFFFPAPFILFGGLSQFFISRYGRPAIFSVFIFVVYLLFNDVVNTPLKYAPNRQMQRAEKVADTIAEKSGGSRFNLAVIADNNYEDGYQYFLEKKGLPVYDINPLDYANTLADQLYVVCEVPENKCDPVNSPKAGVANFGWSKIADSWKVQDVLVYKLVHAK